MKYVYAAIAAATIAIGAWIWSGSAWESTDDATIEADVVTLSAVLAGHVAQVLVREHQRVHVGEVLFTLDDRTLRSRLAAAEAELAEARALARSAALEAEAARATSGSNDAALRASVADSTSTANAASAETTLARATLARATSDVSLATTRRDRERGLVAIGTSAATKLEDADADLTHASVARAEAASALDAAAARAAAATARTAAARGHLGGNMPAELRIAVADAHQAEQTARVSAAEAAVESVQTDLANARVIAPADGEIAQLAAFVGTYVAPGQALAELVPDARYVVAQLKETQISRLREGMPVEIEVDALPGVTLRGKVETIAPGTGARFAALRPDNASGNFVKVVQRVPVRIALVDPAGTHVGLRAGLSTEVHVRVQGKP